MCRRIESAVDGQVGVAHAGFAPILALRGSLTAEEFQKTLNACTESQYFSDHSGLIPQLSKWLFERSRA